MRKTDKVLWVELIQEFKANFPALGKAVFRYAPYDYMQIKIWLTSGDVLIYDAEKNKLFGKE